MTPAWKTYTIAEWDKLCGVSPDLRHKETGGGFVYNSHGVCMNPHVLGIVGRGWRFGIFTAQTPSGLWSHCRDISFPSAGISGLPCRLDFSAERTEVRAQLAELEYAANFVTQNADRKLVSCPIPGAQAREALRLISEKIAELEPKKVPTFTQLSLFD